MPRKRRRQQQVDIEALPLRQRSILSDLERFGFLSTSLVAEFHYADIGAKNTDKAAAGKARRTVARRDLNKLVDKEVVKSFSMRHGGPGGPESIYCLAGTRIPRNLCFMPHVLATVRLVLILRAGCERPHKKPYSFEFLMEYDGTEERRKDDMRPDLVFCVGRDRAKGLYLVETDLSTEPLRSSDRKRATICGLPPNIRSTICDSVGWWS